MARNLRALKSTQATLCIARDPFDDREFCNSDASAANERTVCASLCLALIAGNLRIVISPTIARELVNEGVVDPRLWIPRRLLRLLARKITTSIESDEQIGQAHCFHGLSLSVRLYLSLRSLTAFAPGNSLIVSPMTAGVA